MRRYGLSDSTIVQTYQHMPAPVKGGSDQAIGRSRGKLTLKIHAIVDAAGKTVALSLTPEQRVDITEVGPLLDEVAPEAFIADKAMMLIRPSNARYAADYSHHPFEEKS